MAVPKNLNMTVNDLRKGYNNLDLEMDNDINISETVIFYRYAGKSEWRWKKLIGWPLEHKTLGKGTLVDIKSRGKSPPILNILFDSDEEISKFLPDSFSKGFFTLNDLPEGLDGIETVRKSLQNELKQKIEDERRQEVERIQKEKEKEKEIEATRQFSILRSKYRIEATKEISPTSPLFKMLIKLENKDWLSREDIRWLERKRLNQFLAEYFAWKYKHTDDGWDLLKEGKYWRKAKQPKRVADMRVPTHLNDVRLISAIHTNRGGVYRDMGLIEEAEQCANKAISVNKSYYPYDLLGAIYYQRGDSTTGDQHFQTALDLGARPKDQDFQVQEIVKTSDKSVQRTVAQCLLHKDPERYKWAEFYQKEDYTNPLR